MDDSWSGVAPVSVGGLDNLVDAYKRAQAAAAAPQVNTTVMAKSNPYVPGPAAGGGWDAGPFPGGYDALNPGKLHPSSGHTLSLDRLTPPQPAAAPPPLPLDDMLSAAAAQEGQRYQQRRLAAAEPEYSAANTSTMAKSDPWKGIQSTSDQRNAPLRAPLGEAPAMPAAAGQQEGGWLSLTGVPPAPQPAQPTDYQGMALNSGNNLSNKSFADLYDRSVAARGQNTPVDPLGEASVQDPADDMAPPQASPMERYNRSKNASNFLLDAALSFNPATAGMYAGWNAADLIGNAAQHVQAGEYGNAAMSAAGAALNAAGVFPGGGTAARYAQEAAAAGRPRSPGASLNAGLPEWPKDIPPEMQVYLQNHQDIHATYQSDLAKAEERYHANIPALGHQMANMAKGWETEFIKRKYQEDIGALTKIMQGDKAPAGWNPGTKLGIFLGGAPGTQRMLPAVPFGKNTYPEYVQAALGDWKATQQAASPAEFKDHLQALAKNRAIEPDTRHYFNEVNNYAFRPAGSGDYSNNIMQAYMNKTGGQMGKPVPINDLYREYLASVKQRDAAGLKKTGGAEFYTKDIDAFNKHIHLFGRRVGETFDQVPTKPAPWLIDPQQNTVAFSPYIPENPMIRALGGGK